MADWFFTGKEGSHGHYWETKQGIGSASSDKVRRVYAVWRADGSRG